MIINIPDHIEGKERRRQIDIIQVSYALSLFDGNRVKASDFLGITRRCLQKKLNYYDELKPFRLPSCADSIKDNEDYQEMLRRYPDGN